MKYFLLAIITVISISLFIAPSSVSAQTACAKILNLQVQGTVEMGKKFQCLVTTDKPNSPDVACGIRIGDLTQWPSNYCPSDSTFGGWNGNTATFNCVIPQRNDVTNSTQAELVAYDFQSSCGPQTGKTLSIKINSSAGQTGTVAPTQPTQPPQSSGGTTDLDTCVGYSVNALIENIRKTTGSDDLAGKVKDRIIKVCTGNTSGQNPSPSLPVFPTGQYPSTPPGSGELYDMNELLNPSSKPSDVALSAARDCMPLRGAYESASQALSWPANLWPIIAGIDFREDSCRPTASCIDGKTIVGNAVPSLGINCSANETNPGSPVKIGGGCGFKDKTHALRWCVNHLIGKGYLIGKDAGTNMEELGVQVAGYNGVPGNTNCRTGVPYSYCPAPFKYADNLYAWNKYFSPKFPNYENMWLIWCGDGAMCSFPRDTFGGPGVFAVAQAISWLLHGGN